MGDEKIKIIHGAVETCLDYIAKFRNMYEGTNISRTPLQFAKPAKSQAPATEESPDKTTDEVEENNQTSRDQGAGKALQVMRTHLDPPALENESPATDVDPKNKSADSPALEECDDRVPESSQSCVNSDKTSPASKPETSMILNANTPNKDETEIAAQQPTCTFFPQNPRGEKTHGEAKPPTAEVTEFQGHELTDETTDIPEVNSFPEVASSTAERGPTAVGSQPDLMQTNGDDEKKSPADASLEKGDDVSTSNSEEVHPKSKIIQRSSSDVESRATPPPHNGPEEETSDQKVKKEKTRSSDEETAVQKVPAKADKLTSLENGEELADKKTSEDSQPSVDPAIKSADARSETPSVTTEEQIDEKQDKETTSPSSGSSNGSGDQEGVPLLIYAGVILMVMMPFCAFYLRQFLRPKKPQFQLGYVCC